MALPNRAQAAAVLMVPEAQAENIERTELSTACAPLCVHDVAYHSNPRSQNIFLIDALCLMQRCVVHSKYHSRIESCIPESMAASVLFLRPSAGGVILHGRNTLPS